MAASLPYNPCGVLERKFWMTYYGMRALAMAVQRPIVLWYDEDCSDETNTTSFNVVNHRRYVHADPYIMMCSLAFMQLDNRKDVGNMIVAWFCGRQTANTYGYNLMKDGVGISALNERLRTIAMPCATARHVLLRPNGITSWIRGSTTTTQ